MECASCEGVRVRYRQPSYGRGPNAAAYDRLTAAETDRRRWYPKPGEYLRVIRRADAITAGGGRIKIDWADTDGKNAEQWAREKRRALHARINAKGGQRYSRYNDPHTVGLATCFVRDAFRLRNGSIKQYGFESRVCRERLAHLDRKYIADD